MLYDELNRRFAILLVVAATVGGAVGCGEEPGAENDGEMDYSTFEPFDESNLASQQARLESHTEIVSLRKEATTDNAEEIYGDIESEYNANDLSSKVEGRTDDHLDVEGWGHDDLGEFWHSNITNAIEMGKAGESEAEIAWAGQVIDKGLQVFFYYSVYHELYLKKRANFDEAYGYYGLNYEGEPREHAPLATNAAGREDEYSLVINQPIFEAFIDARHALANGTDSNDDELGENETYDAAFKTIDNKMLEILAHYAAHEIKELNEDNADIKLIEARVIWEAIAPYAAEVDSETADAIIDGLYPEGRPDRGDDNYFYTDLQDVRDGTIEIDAQSLEDDMYEIAGTLGE